MKYALKSSAFLCLSVTIGCANSVPVGNGEWVEQPPPVVFCEPGQEVIVDEHLIANCTAMTKSFGDWFLGLTEQGMEVLGWKF